jgi:uncharacterized protein
MCRDLGRRRFPVNNIMKKSLRIPINSIPEVGKELSLDLGKEWFARWRDEDPDLEFAAGAITGNVRLEKHGHDILVRGRLQGHLELTCSRCLEVFVAPVAVDFDLLLAPAPDALAADSEELSSADLDLDFYHGETVDLEEILREQIILAVPLKPLCLENCRGLCPRCGADLNRETCSCQPEESDSLLAPLAKLKE